MTSTTMYPTQTGDIAAAIDAGKRIAPRQPFSCETTLPGVRRTFIALEGLGGRQELVEFDTTPKLPAFYHATPQFATIESFCAYVSRFKQEDRTQVYVRASEGSLTFRAVINDYAPADDAPKSHHSHVATFQPKASRELLAWQAKDGKPFEGNIAFAEWLEDQHYDVTKPPGADFLQMALSMKIEGTTKFMNAHTLADGSTTIDIAKIVNGTAQNSAGNRIKIPQQFEIAIPVFEGLDQPKYKFEARFRHRLRDQDLHIHYQLIRPHKVIELAARTLITSLEKQLSGVPIYYV